MKFLVKKAGVILSEVYAWEKKEGIFWVANRKRATEFNLTKARKIARAEKAMVVPS